jgi:acetyl-CoA C-acetyltransferase
VSEVWSRFAAVAAGNPSAWSRQAYTPEEIRTTSPDNRMVCFPYPKRMCANIDVDQAAALLLCSYEAARAAGVADDDRRPLTVTGGLGFAGGPVNNYPTHAIARMVEVLRADPASIGCTTALGWYITKHASAVWSAVPPEHGYRRVDPAVTQARVDAQPRREPAGLIDGDVTIEATSVNFERDGSPVLGIVAALTGDGRRALANTRDPDLLAALVTDAHEGRPARVTNDGTTNTIHAA